MNYIIYTDPKDNKVRIAGIAENIDIEVEAKRLGISFYEECSVDCIPLDRSHREAWLHDTTTSPHKISVNANKAREISLSRVRSNREVLLKDLDLKYNIANRNGEDTVGLDYERKALLDATEPLKSLEFNNDIISVQEATEILLPLEVIK